MVLSRCCLFWTYISDSALEYKSVCLFILDAVVAFSRSLCSSSRYIWCLSHLNIYNYIRSLIELGENKNSPGTRTMGFSLRVKASNLDNGIQTKRESENI